MTGRHVAVIILLVLAAATISYALYSMIILGKEDRLPIISIGAMNAVVAVILLRTANTKSDE